MAVLSPQIIETLIELVEHRLLEMSDDNREHRGEYKDLQGCRYSLLALAADEISAEAYLPLERRVVKRPDYLRLIAGGKP